MDRLRLMKTFVTVVQSSGFSAAAEKLGVSRAIASKYLKELEDQIGARLLNRTTRSLSLTAIGIEYYDFCLRLVGEVEDMETNLRLLQREARGLLKVVVPPSFAMSYLIQEVLVFLKLYPRLRISLIVNDVLPAGPTLFEDGIDLAITLSAVADSSIIARRVGEVRWVLCATPAYLAAHPEVRVPSDLAAHNCLVHLRHAPDGVWRFVSNGREVAVPVSGTLSANNAFVLRTAVLADEGLAFLPAFSCHDDLRKGRLRPVLADWPAVRDRPLFILYPHRRLLPWKVRLFIDFFAGRVAAVGEDLGLSG